jgi:succinate dehydrogenase/fumarate reductase-like Fe-S protein
MDKNISFTLKVWRQAGPKAKGEFKTYQMKDIPGDTSFLEMLDILNEELISKEITEIHRAISQGIPTYTLQFSAKTRCRWTSITIVDKE